jgi:low affinity Fe/Cu permease
MSDQQNGFYGFSRFAGRAADLVGTPWAFVLAMATIAVWAALGPKFHFSDSWQLVMNTWTNFVTFAMVFLIQHAQNRDSKAINLKLNEIVRALKPADDELINVEKLSNEELERLEKRYDAIRKAVQQRRGKQ